MFENKPSKNNIFSYHGPISIDMISFMAKYLKEMVVADKKVLTRLFKVFIELTQNVSYYSAQVNENRTYPDSRRGVGWFTIEEYENEYIISTGNLVLSEHKPILINNCVEINSLNEEELRELKRKTRTQACTRDIGAHIGLIQTGLISSNPLKVEFSEVDEKHSFFIIKVTIDKNN